MRSTAKAMLIRIEGCDVEEWFPYSQMQSYPSDPWRGEDVDITIPVWLAREKGIMD